MQITMELLSKFMACAAARNLVKKLLPLEISVEVDDNTQVAIRLINHYTLVPVPVSRLCLCPVCTREGPAHRTLISDLRWLLAAVCNKPGVKQYANDVFKFGVELSNGGNRSNKLLDPWVVAQVLSWTADAYEQRRER